MIGKIENYYLKTYAVLALAGRKNPTLTAVENSYEILNNPLKSAEDKMAEILKNVIFIKSITADKMQNALKIINGQMKIKNFISKCYKCKVKKLKTDFSLGIVTCDACRKNPIDNNF